MTLPSPQPADPEIERYLLLLAAQRSPRTVDAYRRALSPFPVREHVVPLLSEALADEAATFETLVTASAGHADELPSLRAEN